jgi:uncharacterized protein
MRANIILETQMYYPDASAKKVTCPVLLAAGRDDVLCPYRSAVRMAKMNPKIQLVTLECGHFEPYGPNEIHDKLIVQQTEFLARNLKLGDAGAAV